MQHITLYVFYIGWKRRIWTFPCWKYYVVCLKNGNCRPRDHKYVRDPLDNLITWYKISNAGMQVTEWNFQNKGTHTSLTLLCFGSAHCVTWGSEWSILLHVTGSSKRPLIASCGAIFHNSLQQANMYAISRLDWRVSKMRNNEKHVKKCLFIWWSSLTLVKCFWTQDAIIYS